MTNSPPLLLVTISRTWADWATPTACFRTALLLRPDTVLVHGAAPKGDRDLATIWANLGGAVHAVPADWEHCGPGCPDQPHRRRNWANAEFCPLAGFRRNQQMVDMGPDWAVAFIRRDSAGATDCLNRITRASIPRSVYRDNTKQPPARP